MATDSGLPDIVADEEPLARFLTSSSHFNSTSVKKGAFIPNKKDGEMSVTRHSGEPMEELAEIGKSQLEKVYGAAILKASEFRKEKLDVLAAEPPPRHANVVGWPWRADDPVYGKSERNEIAMALAQKATRVIFA